MFIQCPYIVRIQYTLSTPSVFLMDACVLLSLCRQHMHALRLLRERVDERQYLQQQAAQHAEAHTHPNRLLLSVGNLPFPGLLSNQV